MSKRPLKRRLSATGPAIVTSVVVLLFVTMGCSVVLGVEFIPLHLVGRIRVIGDAGGSWGAPWEAVSRPPSAYQQDALGTVVRTTSQLGLACLAISTLSLVLHTVSRVLAMWRTLAIRCALGATLRHLVAPVGAPLLRLVVIGAGIGAGMGAVLLALLSATWPTLFSRPSLLVVIGAAFGATVYALLVCGVIALGLLIFLQRGVRSVSHLHGTNVTTGGGLLFAQTTLAVVQLAALLVVTYGCALILRTSARSATEGVAAARDSLVIAPMAWSGAPGVPYTRAERLRAAASFTPPFARATLTSPDAWIGMGKEVPVLGVCGECRLGGFFYPLNSGTVRVVAIGPGALRARHITQAGREFTAGDTLGSARVAIVNMTAARMLYPGATPILKPLRAGPAQTEYAIVGFAHFEPPPVFGNTGRDPIVFVPILQHPPATSEVLAPTSAWDSLRAGLVAAMPADAPSFGNPRPLHDRMQEFIDPIGWFGALFAGLAGSATGIATYSLVAVMMQMVALRERDIAIRMAIGADERRIERWILGRTVWMTVAGTTIGLTGARWVGVLLHGDKAPPDGDLAWLALMVLGFGTLGVLASLLPARRAARIEPARVWAQIE